MADLPADPFGRVHGPSTSDYSREARAAHFAEVADALVTRRTPDPVSAMFVGSACMARLQDDSVDLERRLGLRQRGSHRTLSRIYAEGLRLIADDDIANRSREDADTDSLDDPST